MTTYQIAKNLVRQHFDALDKATPETVADVLKAHTSEDYFWRGVYPFREQHGADAAAKNFWSPLLTSLTRMQRRQDIFIAGENELGGEQWVMSMGNFMGLFDADWLGIPRTRKIANLRYAEFNCVVDGKITQTGLFVDVIGLRVQAGTHPRPHPSGGFFNSPGPRHHRGVVFPEPTGR
ncbi:MAG: nuclear transport factor 2 family protein, partial [Anaerolineae bacterium]|nr:nuclear transport factor 2 family protein [Anaerolineae bacterium]